MKTKYFFCLIGLLLITTGMITFNIEYLQRRVPINNEKVLKSNFKPEKKSKYYSQKKKKLKGLIKKDNPDLFAKYHQDIRTRIGEILPTYKPNYRFRELLNAKSNLYFSLHKSSKISKLQWTDRGPGNVSGRTRAIVVDPDDPNFNTWYAGSASGGVWKTNDAGMSWVELTASISNLSTCALIMAPSNPNIMYLGTGEGYFNFNPIDGSGIWKSEDRGKSWRQLNGTEKLGKITRLVVDPKNENTVIASVTSNKNYLISSEIPKSGVYKTINGGENWEQIFVTDAGAVYQIISNPKNFNTLMISVPGEGIFKSNNCGRNWIKTTGIKNDERTEIAISSLDTTKVYASVATKDGWAKFYVSNDAGNNWMEAKDSLFNPNWFASQGYYNNTIGINPFNENEVFVGGVDLWKIDVQKDRTFFEHKVERVDKIGEKIVFELVQLANSDFDGGGFFAENYLGSDSLILDDYSSVEIRMGRGKKQKAHRYIVDENENYHYQDYIEVPFEVWDIDNNRQLMVGFRDHENNGAFDLEDRLTALGSKDHEFIFITSLDYDKDVPNKTLINNFKYKNIFFIWPESGYGNGPVDFASVTDFTYRIICSYAEYQKIEYTNIADTYQQYGNSDKGVHCDLHNLTFIPVDEKNKKYRLLIGNDGGVTYTDNEGYSFVKTLNGYNTTQFYGVDKMNGSDRYIGGTQDNGCLTSPIDPFSLSHWTHAPSGDGFQSIWHFTNPRKILQSSQFNNIIKSIDGGETWQESTSNLWDVGAYSAPFYTKLAGSKINPDLVFAVGKSGIWKSIDFGDSWSLIDIGDGWTGCESNTHIKISLGSPDIVWTGSQMTEDIFLYLSKDEGRSFHKVNSFNKVKMGNISGIETDPIDKNTAYVLFSFAEAPKILKTTDFGQSWKDISGFGENKTSSNGFPDVAVFSLLVMPFDQNIIWVGTEIGLFETIDGGISWHYADNGLPAVSISEMKIVNDEVVLATHGRGIWTVTLDELKGFEPPGVILTPYVENIKQNWKNAIIKINLPSEYDSTHIFINDAKIKTISRNNISDTTFYYSLNNVDDNLIETIKTNINSYKNGKEYKSANKEFRAILFKEPIAEYTDNFDSGGFCLNTGLSQYHTEGFSSKTMNSMHPYRGNTEASFTLFKPIIVSENNSFLRYRDVAIVEPGEENTRFGDKDFYDYVVVEASKDILNWVALAPGYDARFDKEWLNAYENKKSGDESMLIHHNINLLDKFEAGDTIAIRFRLFADLQQEGWGWAIEDLEIQTNNTSIIEKTDLPNNYSLKQNYPNPFNPVTNIQFDIPENGNVKLEVYSILGEKICTLVDKNYEAGRHNVHFNGEGLSSGIYFYKIISNDFVKVKKMMLIK